MGCSIGRTCDSLTEIPIQAPIGHVRIRLWASQASTNCRCYAAHRSGARSGNLHAGTCRLIRRLHTTSFWRDLAPRGDRCGCVRTGTWHHECSDPSGKTRTSYSSRASGFRMMRSSFCGRSRTLHFPGLSSVVAGGSVSSPSLVAQPVSDQHSVVPKQVWRMLAANHNYCLRVPLALSQERIASMNSNGLPP